LTIGPPLVIFLAVHEPWIRKSDRS
jgi:hypothetical protein